MNVINNDIGFFGFRKNLDKPCLCSEPDELGENGNEDGCAG